MYRFAATSFTIILILAGTALGVSQVMSQQAHIEVKKIINYRSSQIESERNNWKKLDDQGIAAQGNRDEALRTLDMLQDLYAQEKRLWQYYHALDAQLKTRSRLAEERAELEQRITTHESRLRELDASIEHLRPPEDAPPTINFSSPETK